MKRFFFAIGLMCLTSIAATAQSNMTDNQVAEFIIEQHEQGATQSEIVMK